MILQELVNKYKFSEIWPRFIELYPDQDEAFDSYNWVYSVEFQKEPIYKDEKISINIKFVHCNDIPSDSYFDVFGIKEGSDQEWAIELESFRNWLGYEISQELLNKMSGIDIICHCIWETTFFGYSEEEKQGMKNQLNESYEKALKQISKENDKC